MCVCASFSVRVETVIKIRTLLSSFIFFPSFFFLKILLKRLLTRWGKTTTKEKRDPDLVPKSIFPQSALYNRETTTTTKKMKTSYLAGDECGEVSSRKQLVFVHAFDDVERCGDFRPLRRHGAVVEASQPVDFQRVQRFLEER